MGVMLGVRVWLAVLLAVMEVVDVPLAVQLPVKLDVAEDELVTVVLGEDVSDVDTVPVGVEEGVEPDDKLLLGVAVALAVWLWLGVVVAVDELLAVDDFVGEYEGVCVAVIVVEGVGSAGASATPKYAVFAGAIARGAPPFSHVSVAVLKPYMFALVTTYSVTLSLCSAACWYARSVPPVV